MAEGFKDFFEYLDEKERLLKQQVIIDRAFDKLREAVRNELRIKYILPQHDDSDLI